MARYDRGFDGERRTAFLGIQLTPTERADLDAAAHEVGAPVSAFARELLLRRGATVVASTRRNPEAAKLMRELNAIGNLLNQIARHLHTTGDTRPWDDLPGVLDLHKRALSRILDL
jgi:hypothetical protein